MDQAQSESKRPESQTLRRNLAALERVDPRLAERLCWPQDDCALEVDGAGRVVLVTPGIRQPLDLDRGCVESACSAVAGDGRVRVFGVGLGEIPTAMLAGGAERVVAWEREPALLRAALERQDWSRALRDRRLELNLAGDWAKFVGSNPEPGPRGLGASPGQGAWVRHPILSEQYHDEWLAKDARPTDPRVVLQQGGLYVDSLAASLRSRGYAVLRLDFQGCSTEELEHSMGAWGPRFIACINWSEGLEVFARRMGLEVLCWEIDPCTTPPRPVSIETSHVHIFSYRRSQVSAWRSAGYDHVESMPLAADIHKRCPGVDSEPCAVGPVTFVGNSLVGCVEAHRERFLDLHRRWVREAARPAEDSAALAERLVGRQQVDGTPWQLDRDIDAVCPGFRSWCATIPPREDPSILLGEGPASHHRLEIVASLAEHGVEVWGDRGWSCLEERGVRFRGPAAHGAPLTKIYRESSINIDIARLYQADIVPMRVFDVLACGGFLLVEHSEDLECLFDVGREILSYRSIEELGELVRHFLAHPEERLHFANVGREVVLERFSFDSRVDRMLGALHGRGSREANPHPPDRDLHANRDIA